MNAPYGDPTDPQPIGSSNDIAARVLSTLPRRWWQWGASVRGFVVGGLSDGAAFCYNWITYAVQQSRLATATGFWLDIIALDFLGRNLTRQGASDTLFRTQIMSTILQERVTRKGMAQVLTNLLGLPPVIIEPWNPGDCGGYGSYYGGYGKVGAWGSLKLPNQCFIRITRAGLAGIPAGVPKVSGYGGWMGGYQGKTPSNFGSMEYIGSLIAQTGLTDAVIETQIHNTRPTGTIMWIHID